MTGIAGGTFLDNPGYVRYVHLLKELHLLMKAGKSETDEAEALRDEMTDYWCGLSPEEVELVSILSADLYMMEGKEIFRSVPAEQRARAWLGPRLREAYGREDWVGALALLRAGPDFLSPDELAQERALCYRQLGHEEVALLFYDYAARLTRARTLELAAA